jgi:anti-sigma regulatory factor (Ser/Thr protein kinase)
MIFGHHVNRAARIEPLAVPGGICASQPFVALLKAETAEHADAARQAGEDYSPRYDVTYLGKKELPKQFGTEDIYALKVLDAFAHIEYPEELLSEARISPPFGMRIEIAGDTAEIPRLAARVDSFCAMHDLDEATARAVNLSLDELITNTMTYGFDSVAEAHIEVALSLEKTTLTVRLTDAGKEFDPTTAPEPDIDADIDDRPIGGLGVYFARQMMDSIAYQRRDGQNVVTLVKTAAAAAPKDP